MMRARYSLRNAIWRWVIIGDVLERWGVFFTLHSCPRKRASSLSFLAVGPRLRGDEGLRGSVSDISHIYHGAGAGSIGRRSLGSLDHAGDCRMPQRIPRLALENYLTAF